MFVVDAVRSKLSVKISLVLSVTLLVLTAVAAIVITALQTREMEAMMLEKARLAASVGARQVSEAIEASIGAGLLTVNEAFDKNYVEIKGYDWGPKPKYHTKYDSVTDRILLGIQDKFLENHDFVYAVAVDVNGYIPTHNTVYQKPLTGDLQKDMAVNRTKRFFNNAVELAAAKNQEPSLLQIYHRDTGETMWDVASPIYVKGKHWGGFRVGASMIRIEERKRALFLMLVGIFTLFAFATVATMFAVVQRAMKPVIALTAAADQISLGEALDTPIKSSSVDEIGQLTKTIDRLRASMKAAMSRLGH
jgi:HAMP domain-containing protein